RMKRDRKIFAGAKLRSLRERHGLSQAALAARLGISVSYLSQVETDTRPLTVAILLALGREFSVDFAGFGQDESSRLVSDLREALSDPLFEDTMPGPQELKRAVAQTPVLAKQFVTLHQAFRQLHERLLTMDEAIGAQE